MSVITTPDLAMHIGRKLSEGGYALIGDQDFVAELIKTGSYDAAAAIIENVDVFFCKRGGDIIGEAVAKASEIHMTVKITVPRPTIFTFQSRYWIAIPKGGNEACVLGFITLPEVFQTRPSYRRDVVRAKVRSLPVDVTNEVTITAPAATK